MYADSQRGIWFAHFFWLVVQIVIFLHFFFFHFFFPPFPHSFLILCLLLFWNTFAVSTFWRTNLPPNHTYGAFAFPFITIPLMYSTRNILNTFKLEQNLGLASQYPQFLPFPCWLVVELYRDKPKPQPYTNRTQRRFRNQRHQLLCNIPTHAIRRHLLTFACN